MINTIQEYNTPPGTQGSDLIEIGAFCQDSLPCVQKYVERSSAGGLATIGRKGKHGRGVLRVIRRKDAIDGSGEVTYGEHIRYESGTLSAPFATLRVIYDNQGIIIQKTGSLNGKSIENFDDVIITTNWLLE